MTSTVTKRNSNAMYTKLAQSIINSSIWSCDPVTCKVWITLLAMANQHGEVIASVPGIARIADVSVKEAGDAIDLFQQPDKYSSSKDFDGRRIKEIDGGWWLLNHEKFRKLASKDEQKSKSAIRQKRYRENKALRSSVTKRNTVTHSNATVTQERDIAEADTETKAEADPAPPSTGTAQDQDPWSNLGTTGKPLKCPKEEHTEVLTRIFNGVTQKKQELYQSKAKK